MRIVSFCLTFAICCSTLTSELEALSAAVSSVSEVNEWNVRVSFLLLAFRAGEVPGPCYISMDFQIFEDLRSASRMCEKDVDILRTAIIETDDTIAVKAPASPKAFVNGLSLSLSERYVRNHEFRTSWQITSRSDDNHIPNKAAYAVWVAGMVDVRG
jgi:hypothetical protein